MNRLLIILILSIAASAQTAVDAMLTLKNSSPVAPGTQASATILNNGMIGSGVTWSFNSGTASTITVGPHQSACNIDAPVSIGGTVYTPAQPSQSFAYNTNNNFTTYFADLPAGHRSVTLNFCIVTNSAVNNLYDIIGSFDVQGHYAMVQQRNTTQLNIETDVAGTQHSPAIPITIGNSYNCDFNANETTGLARLACYQPTYPYTQLACTPIGTGANNSSCDANGTIQIGMQTGRDPSRFRVGNNEVGVANATTYIENLIFDYTNGAFPLGVRTQYAPWAGILSPTRAIDWSGAGYIGGIPIRSRCTTGPGVSALSASSTTAQINAALTGCDNEHAVELAAGTFNGLGMITIPNFRTLRGAGADQTHLNFTSAGGCTGQLTLICNAGDNTDKTNRRNQTNWTAGFFPGTTKITLAGPLSNLVIGKAIILDQSDDTTDAGGIVVSDTTSSMTATSPGVAGPRSLEGNGGGSQTPGRQQQQEVVVTGCNGSTTVGASCTGSNQVITISPGLYMPNWDATRSPQAYWATTQHEGGGVENLSIDSGSDTNSAMVFKWLNTKNTYIKGVRSNAAYRAHLQMQFASHGTIQDSYFFLNQGGGPTNYGVECYGASDVLIVNNIFQAVTGPIPLNSACEGNVIAYNYFTNIYYSNSAGWNNPFGNQHTAGTEFNLIEGNVGDGWDGDVFHGTHHFNTFFRNRFIGTQPLCYATGTTYANSTYAACNNNRFGLQFRSWSRFYNVIGNVLGTTGTNTIYASTAGDHTVYTLNDGNTNGSVTVPDDPNVTTTLLRWGNYDVVNAANRFVSSELPSAPSATVQTPFGNFVPSFQTLPASLYYSSQPSWWPVAKPWPPVGPDVTGGNLSGVAGHAYTIPAQDCAAALGIPSDGTGPIVAFNPSCSAASAQTIYRPTVSVDTGDVAVTNPANNYDGNIATLAQGFSSNDGNTQTLYNITYKGFPTAVGSPVSVTLYVSNDAVNSAAFGVAEADYSIDGGVNWNTIWSGLNHGTNGHPITDRIVLAPTQDFTKVQVRFMNSGCAPTTPTCTVIPQFYETWIQTQDSQSQFSGIFSGIVQ